MADKTDRKSHPGADETGDRVQDLGETAGQPDERRRQMLGLLKKAAIAGPVLMTLKSTPARAASGSNVSAGGG